MTGERGNRDEQRDLERSIQLLTATDWTIGDAAHTGRAELAQQGAA